MAGLTRSSKVTSRTPLPSARRRGMLVGMAKPLAKLVALITPKRRWAQFSLLTMLVFMVLPALGIVGQFAPVVAQKHERAIENGEAGRVTGGKGDSSALTVTKWLEGEAVSKFESGKVYVVEFWATWCGPCVANMPHLAELQARYKDQGVTIIGFTSRDIRGVPDNSEEKVAAFVKKQGPMLGYTFAYADDDTTAAPWMEGQRYFCTFVVDRAGRIAYVGHPMFLNLVLPSSCQRCDAKRGRRGRWPRLWRNMKPCTRTSSVTRRLD